MHYKLLRFACSVGLLVSTNVIPSVAAIDIPPPNQGCHSDVSGLDCYELPSVFTLSIDWRRLQRARPIGHIIVLDGGTSNLHGGKWQALICLHLTRPTSKTSSRLIPNTYSLCYSPMPPGELKSHMSMYSTVVIDCETHG